MYSCVCLAVMFDDSSLRTYFVAQIMTSKTAAVCGGFACPTIMDKSFDTFEQNKLFLSASIRY